MGGVFSVDALSMSPSTTRASNWAFFDQLMPSIATVNQNIVKEQHELRVLYQHWQQSYHLSEGERNALTALARRYRIAMAGDAPITVDAWQALIKRVQPVPAPLVLAQSAEETGFGHSRFAREGHNYFGQHCHAPGCGLVPLQAKPGHHFEVTRYASVTESIAAYVHNLNTHSAYTAFRDARNALKEHWDRPENLHRLVRTLSVYSEKGEVYPEHLWKLIQNYDLLSRTHVITLQ